MFAVENLWKIDALKPLQKAYAANQMDRRLVVVAGDPVNIDETVALHAWLEGQGYQHIPDTWESAQLDQLEVVHISKLTIQIMRRNPFLFRPAPLAPNSWLAKLPQDRFDALLLAQESGDVPFEPTTMHIKDSLMPQLTAPELSPFWRDTVADVQFAQSGAAPRNARQKQVLERWVKVLARRHYDPTGTVGTFSSNPPQPAPQEQRVYVWREPGDQPLSWNWRHTQLRKWIAASTSDVEELRAAVVQVFGSTSSVKITGRMNTDAYSVVEEALKRNKLDDLANLYGFELEAPAESAFNQTGQVVGGDQINVTIGAGARGVAVGRNIVQSVISTGGGIFNTGIINTGGNKR